MSGLWSMFWFKFFSKNFSKNYDLLYFRSLVGNSVAVGGPTNKSGCLPSTALWVPIHRIFNCHQGLPLTSLSNYSVSGSDKSKKLLLDTTRPGPTAYDNCVQYSTVGCNTGCNTSELCSRRSSCGSQVRNNNI
jgi:hypothetical protein